MKHIGPHVSATGGVENAPLNAVAVGATAFALFLIFLAVYLIQY